MLQAGAVRLEALSSRQPFVISAAKATSVNEGLHRLSQPSSRALASAHDSELVALLALLALLNYLTY